MKEDPSSSFRATSVVRAGHWAAEQLRINLPRAFALALRQRLEAGNPVKMGMLYDHV